MTHLEKIAEQAYVWAHIITLRAQDVREGTLPRIELTKLIKYALRDCPKLWPTRETPYERIAVAYDKKIYYKELCKLIRPVLREFHYRPSVMAKTPPKQKGFYVQLNIDDFASFNRKREEATG